MTSLFALWLPILVSAVLVFLASAIIHMSKLWHKNDYPSVPDQDRLMAAVRPFAIPPGEYMVPRAATMKEMSSPEFVEKLNAGPVMLLSVLPNGRITMGKSLTLWFVYVLVVGIFAAYIASRALAPGADYLRVFQFAGATSFLGYAVALWQMSIWFNRSCKLSLTATLDGLIYALLTAGVFGWLWPSV
ncbi:MAG TPA: hypothetical protein PLL30_12405 [Candidatus Krumholzibacteria bacterium]|nr:hypothetical protein [Candidatus Krumholzibacteria bacterium]HPD72570.1 hypothetical protein [Candidatus Krumholzibacteria bacterium]HRY40498.1 hypothetical protein [Candidatus Krumholzibacteria bacterium]